jgi:hypothetical protein
MILNSPVVCEVQHISKICCDAERAGFLFYFFVAFAVLQFFTAMGQVSASTYVRVDIVL